MLVLTANWGEWITIGSGRIKADKMKDAGPSICFEFPADVPIVRETAKDKTPRKHTPSAESDVGRKFG